MILRGRSTGGGYSIGDFDHGRRPVDHPRNTESRRPVTLALDQRTVDEGGPGQGVIAHEATHPEMWIVPGQGCDGLRAGVAADSLVRRACRRRILRRDRVKISMVAAVGEQ